MFFYIRADSGGSGVDKGELLVRGRRRWRVGRGAGGAVRGVQEEREGRGEVRSESVISEAVLNGALRQDVLYMLMFLTNTHTHTQTNAVGFVFS